MKNKPVKLVPRNVRAAHGVIETLKNMTKAAKEEGFSGIAVAAIDKAGYTHTAYERGENVAMLVGALERIKFRLLSGQDQS